VTTSACTVPVAVNPVEQLSVTLADPKAAATFIAVALQFNAVAAASVITGACVCLTNVTVCDAVPVLLHASVTVHVFVTLTLHPVTTSACTVPVAVKDRKSVVMTSAYL